MLNRIIKSVNPKGHYTAPLLLSLAQMEEVLVDMHQALAISVNGNVNG